MARTSLLAWVAVAVAAVAIFNPASLGKAAEAGLPDFATLLKDLAPSVPSSAGPVAGVGGAVARAQLAALPVKGISGASGYSRDAFGQAWADVDHNGCDTRNDILARDLAGEKFRDGSDCVVVSGRLAPDPYTGTDITFDKAAASKVQIDHVYPLSLAWQHGADSWSADKRARFANDPANLLAVDGPTNSAKGDSSPAAWMPPSRDSWCAYSTRFVGTASAYGLSVTQADKDMLVRGLDRCGA